MKPPEDAMTAEPSRRLGDDPGLDNTTDPGPLADTLPDFGDRPSAAPIPARNAPETWRRLAEDESELGQSVAAFVPSRRRDAGAPDRSIDAGAKDIPAGQSRMPPAGAIGGLVGEVGVAQDQDRPSSSSWMPGAEPSAPVAALATRDVVDDATRGQVWSAAFALYRGRYSGERAWELADATAGAYDCERTHREERGPRPADDASPAASGSTGRPEAPEEGS